MKFSRLQERRIRGMHESLDPWSRPWHARLKKLADVAANTTEHEMILKLVRTGAAPPPSWLRRATLAVPAPRAK